MGYLSNTWVRYLDRSAEQIMNSLLVRLGIKVKEITDHNPTNPYIRNMQQFSGMSEQLGYYIDNQGRESFIDSLRLYASAVSLAKQHDYQIIGNRGYSTDVVFTISSTHVSDITIPAGTIVNYGTIPYVTQSTATITAGQTVSSAVGVVQYVLITAVSKGLSSGAEDIELEFDEKIMHNSVVVRVDGVTWTSKDTLTFSAPTDEHFVQTINEDGKVVIYFGNENPVGKIPVTGEAIEVDYKVTLGADGFAASGQIDTITSVLSLPGGRTTTVTNPNATSGGGDIEAIDSMRRNISANNRTLRRAVTKEDYEAVIEQAPGVAKAGVYFNCGKAVQAYIVPDGGGIASSVLLTSTLAYINSRKMITTTVTISAAGEVHIKIVADIVAEASRLNATVKSNVETAIVNWLNYLYQEIGGTIVIGDIYQLIENPSLGVRNSVITSFYAEPYARPISTSFPALVWTRTLLTGSTTNITWQIQFTNATDFLLIKSGILVGTFSTAVLVSQTELSFTIAAGGHTSGDTYEFITYPYTSNKIVLTEPSLPVSVVSDLTINVTGGL